MSDKYKISDNDKAYFVTLTTVGILYGHGQHGRVGKGNFTPSLSQNRT